MTLLTDLFSIRDLADEITDGYIKERTHPDLPVAILNYTDRAAFDSAWNPVTSQCRGLIYNTETLRVLARPFPKFFNFGQAGAAHVALDEPVQVLDKLDGSLGILWAHDDAPAEVATRGSFASDQSAWATALYRGRYQGFVPPTGWTVLFEIIYPDNRIVLDYEGMRDLVLLGGRHIDTGDLIGPDHPVLGDWPGPHAQVFGEYSTLTGALAAPPRENAEGLVVRSCATGNIVKIKQDDYIALHRLLTGTTARTVWEFLAVNACRDLIQKRTHWGTYLNLDPARADRVLAAGDNWMDALIRDVPDEFLEWVRNKVKDLTAASDALREEIARVFAEVVSTVGVDDRAFFEATRDYQHQKALLLLKSDRSVDLYVWSKVRPVHELPFRTVSEDVA